MAEIQEGALVFGVTDPLGRAISLTRHTWDRHRAKRPELEGREQQVEETISRPDLIVIAATGERYYYRERRDSTWISRYLQVIVHLDGNRGRVATAWYCPATEEGDFEWASPDLLMH